MTPPLVVHVLYLLSLRSTLSVPRRSESIDKYRESDFATSSMSAEHGNTSRNGGWRLAAASRLLKHRQIVYVSIRHQVAGKPQQRGF
jgi:hypothetical protein